MVLPEIMVITITVITLVMHLVGKVVKKIVVEKVYITDSDTQIQGE